MCGRGACTLDRAEYNKAIEERLALLRLGGKLNDTTAGKEDGGTTGNAKYNVAPGTVCRVVQLPKDGEAGAYVVRDCGWGIKGSRFLVNARGESIEQKFKGLRRCVFFLSGYYEWDKSLGPSKKQPYYFHKKTADPADLLAVACLCSNHNPGSFVVVTRAATSTLSWIHDRVPLLLHTAEDIRQWLDETTPLSDSAPLRLCVKQEDDKEYGKLAFHPVSKEVGKVAYQGPDCIKKVDLTASPSKAAGGGILQWAVKRDGEAKSPQPAEQSQGGPSNSGENIRKRSLEQEHEVIDLGLESEPSDPLGEVVEATDPAKDSGTTASKIPKGKRAHTAASRVVDVVDLDSDSEEVEAVEPPAKKQKAAAHDSLRSEFAAAFKEDPSKVLELMGDSREESGT